MIPTLVFDLGTTYFKACVFGERGQLLSIARTPTPIERPHDRWAQVPAVDFQQSIARLVASLDAGAVAKIGQVSFATQTNSFLLLDQDGEPVTPIILWNDKRAVEDQDTLRVLDTLRQAPGFHEQTGLPKLTALTAGAKLLWLQRQQPECWGRAHRLCLISDYLTRWFTGEDLTEAGAAGLTGLVDIHRLVWRDQAIEACGLTRLALPRIVRAGTPAGSIRPDVADTLGLPERCQFVVGCLDQYAGAIGVGNTVPGRISETTGTVLATVALAEGFDPTLEDRGVFQGPAFKPGWYYRMAVSAVSANLLEAYRKAQLPDWSNPQLSDAAASIPSDGEIPTLDLAASQAQDAPVFLQTDASYGHAQHIRAIMAGVAEALAEHVDRLTHEDRPPEIRCAGGAARSEVWLRIKADALGIPMVAVDCEEPTCLGAGLVSNLVDGQLPAVADSPQIARRADPDPG